MNKLLAPPPPSEAEITLLIERELGQIPDSIETLRSGAWSSSLAVTTSHGGYVVRFAQTPDDFQCDQHASAFATTNLPIPQVFGIGQHGEHWWCISERMPGLHLDDLAPDDLVLTLPSVADMLITMREVDSSGTHGYGGWDADGNGLFESFADQLLDVTRDDPKERGGGWSAFLSQHPYEQSVFDRGAEKMRELSAFLSTDRQLIHMDTINYNVNVVGHAINGIYDWGCAMWGDAIYDLAWFRFWNPWYPAWADLDIPGKLESMVGIEGDYSAERMMSCLLHIGIGHIRYNAFLGDAKGMNDVAVETERLLVTS